MSTPSSVTLTRRAAVLAAIALVLAGAGLAWLLTKRATSLDHRPPSGQAATDASRTAPRSQEPMPRGPETSPPAGVTVRLTPDAVKRAGLVIATASSGPGASSLRLPGVVAADAYRQVSVTPLVTGRVTGVPVELGELVRKGQTLARIYSPELADAQTRYVSAAATLNAHERELLRTQKLVEIGAASRQELERIHAEHAAQTAAVQSARAQLELLGVPIAELDKSSSANPGATTVVPAPIDGVVTERGANVGLNVTPATALFTVVDLSTVWILADVHERDLAGMRVGGEAAITSDALGDTVRRGRITYIAPSIAPETRTAQIRIELPNPSGDLRPGLYVDVAVTGTGGPVTLIPRSAVQQLGSRTVVYLANAKAPGVFVEREVRIGQAAGDQVEVASGIRPGELVVSDGSFFVRAERERLGDVESRSPIQSEKVTVTDQGFEPAQLTLKAGTPARLTFLRTSDNTCATEVAIPSLNERRPLPLNEAVAIDFTPAKSGEITFVCGMNMLKGVIAVK